MGLNLIRASNGNGEAVRASVTGIRASGSTTLAVDALTNWPTNFIATSGSLLPDGTVDPASVLVFSGHISGSSIVIDEIAAGYDDNGNTVGDIVVVKPTTKWADELSETLSVSLNDDGTPKRPTLGETRYYTTVGANTWTKPEGLKFVIVEAIGAGGAGGNTSATGTGQGSASGAGGAGGYGKKKILAGALGATETVTVGTGGARGGGSGATGNGGTASMFGTHLTAHGGYGGSGSGAAGSGVNPGGDGGATVGADFGANGDYGSNGSIGSSGIPARNNNGASSNFGAGGKATSNTTGSDALGYGAGGSGANNTPSQGTAYQGGAGAQGIVIVHEYF